MGNMSGGGGGGHDTYFANTRVAGDHGGAVGTGAAIQAAIDAAAQGDVVQIPAGTWTIPTTILLNKNNISLVGAGRHRTVLQLGGNIDGVRVGPSGTINNIVMGDFSVGTTSDRSSGAAIAIERAGTCELRNVGITNAYGGRPFRGLEIRSGAVQWFYNNLRIAGCADDGIRIVQDGTQSTIVDHYFNKHLQVENCLGRGLAILNQAGSTATSLEGIYVAAGSISGNSTGGVVVDCFGTSVIKNLFFRGTIIDGNTGAGFATSNSGPIQVIRLEDMWVSHNFTNNGVTLTDAVKDFVIDGGHFSLMDKNAILIFGAKHGRIQNCSIMSNGRLQAGDWGILISNNADDVVVQNCKIYNNTDVYGGAYSNGVVIGSGCTDCEVSGSYLDTSSTTVRFSDAGTRTREYGNVYDETATIPPDVDFTRRSVVPTSWAGAANTTTATALVSNSSYFLYLGRINKTLSTIDVVCRVDTLAATITWAEVGIFKGSMIANAASAALIRLGFTNVAATFNSTGVKKTTVALTGHTPGDDLWVAFGSQATTPYQLRAGLADDVQSGGFQSLAATRISTMGATVPTLEGGTLAVPWARVVFA